MSSISDFIADMAIENYNPATQMTRDLAIKILEANGFDENSIQGVNNPSELDAGLKTLCGYNYLNEYYDIVKNNPSAGSSETGGDSYTPSQTEVDILTEDLMEKGPFTDKELAQIAAEESLETTGSLQESREEYNIKDEPELESQTAVEAVAEAYQQANVTVDPTTDQTASEVTPVIDAAAATIAAVDALENYDTAEEALEVGLGISKEETERIITEHPMLTSHNEELPTIDFESPEIGAITSLKGESIYDFIGIKDYSVLSSSADGFSENDINDLISNLNNLDDELAHLLSTAQDISSEYSNLNDTTEAIASSYGIDGYLLQSSANASISKWQDAKVTLVTSLNNILTEIYGADALTIPETPLTVPEIPENEETDDFRPTKMSFSKEVFNPSKITSNPAKKIMNNIKSLGGLGTISFLSIVPMFSKLGGKVIANTRMNTNYDIVGINTYEGKYYYKIYDSKTEKIYYVECDSNLKVEAKHKEVLKAKEVSMMLKNPEIGEDVLAQMTNSNEMYFILDTVAGEGELEGINFANVLNSTDGKNYYIPLSNSVEVISIDSFMNTQPLDIDLVG